MGKQPGATGVEDDGAEAAAEARARRRFGWGSAGSLLLHGLMLLLLLDSPSAAPILDPPLLETTALPVDLVQLGAVTESPPQKEKARLPQEEAQPSPVAPRPTAAPPQVRVAPPRPKPPLHRAVAKPPDGPRPPPDDFSARLKAIETRQQGTSTNANPRPMTGTGASNRDLASDQARLGAHATIGVGDIVRVQIEHIWDFDVTSLGGAGLVIGLHVVLDSDGRVRRVDIVDDPRFVADPHYRALADSARRAALLASPLHLPAGWWSEAASDMILHLDPREATR